MGAIKLAVADGVMTFMWVFCASTLGVATTIIASMLGLSKDFLPLASLAITNTLVFFLINIFGVIGGLLGGASFNPTATASFYVAGVVSDDILSMALRFPAQAAGAVFGALAITGAMPTEHKHMLGGPSLKVGLHTGAIAEGILTSIVSFVVLFVVLRGPRNNLMKTWLLSLSTMVVVAAGSPYTGPSMNPANAFGWAYLKNRHNSWEHFYVYWISPFIGAISAARLFRVVFPPPSQEKKAKKA